jgi:uncharacterized membrane protein
MELFLFLIIGYYLFCIYLLTSIIKDKDYSAKHKIAWGLIVTIVPFLGAIVYTLVFKKQYGRPNELMTIIR